MTQQLELESAVRRDFSGREAVRHLRFAGATYEADHDNVRLGRQLQSIYDTVKDGAWRTLREIAELTGYSEASISAQLRHLRKERFGSHEVNKRIRGHRDGGLYEYQVK